ncbi:MAG: CHASE2 domain-containing protein [Ignavibacteria bacterium]|nr:CHASE2 domain-containing protein [Ignavibacteria bacterium]
MNQFLHSIRQASMRLFSTGFLSRSIDNVAATALVFCALWLLYYVPSSLAILDPLAKAFSDIELSDLVFSRLRDDSASHADTNIVLVNIGTLNRAGIAEEIKRVAAQKPRVIGVDVMFRAPKDSAGDAALSEALQFCPRTVMVSKLADYNHASETFATRQTSYPIFHTYAGMGFANMVSSSDEDAPDALPTDMIRLFSPHETLSDSGAIQSARQKDKEWAFAVKVAWYMDSNAVNRLLARKNGTETINYRGNTDKFYTLDVGDVLSDSANLAFLHGKIVIFGFLGETFGRPSAEDIFFTPMNKQYAGRTFPDMYGAVIHANIASMILSGDYITALPDAVAYVLAALLCFANISFLSYLYYRHPRAYDTLQLALQFAESVALLVAFTAAFHWFRLKLDVTLLVAVVAIAPTIHEIYHTLRTSQRKNISAETSSGDLPATTE